MKEFDFLPADFHQARWRRWRNRRRLLYVGTLAAAVGAVHVGSSVRPTPGNDAQVTGFATVSPGDMEHLRNELHRLASGRSVQIDSIRMGGSAGLSIEARGGCSAVAGFVQDLDQAKAALQLEQIAGTLQFTSGQAAIGRVRVQTKVRGTP